MTRCWAAIAVALVWTLAVPHAQAQPVEHDDHGRWEEAAAPQGESQRDDLAILDRGRLTPIAPSSQPIAVSVGLMSLWALVVATGAWSVAQGLARTRAAWARRREIASFLPGSLLVVAATALLFRGDRWVPANAESIMRLVTGEIGLTAAGVQPQWPSGGAAFAWLWASLLNQPSLRMARALVPVEMAVACVAIAIAAWRLFGSRAAAFAAPVIAALLLHQGAESLAMGAEPASAMLAAALLALAAAPRPSTAELFLLTLLSPLVAMSSQAGWAVVLVAVTLQAAQAASLLRHALPLLVGLGATVVGLLAASELATGSYLNEVAWLLSVQRPLAVLVVVLFAVGIAFAAQARRTPALLVTLVVPLALGTAYFGNVGIRVDPAHSVADVVMVAVALLASGAVATLLEWAPAGRSRAIAGAALGAVALALLVRAPVPPPTTRPYEAELFDVTAKLGRDAWRTHARVYFAGPRETLVAQLLASFKDGWAHENPHVANLPPPKLKRGQPTFPTGCVLVHVGLDDTGVPSTVADGARQTLHLDYFSPVAHITLDAQELEAERCGELDRMAGAVRVL